MSEKLAPSISDAHFEKMMALKPANARETHLCRSAAYGGHRPGVRQAG